MIKSMLRKRMPVSILRRYIALRRLLMQWRNRGKTAEEVFSGIYANNKWGGSPSEISSGSGTADELIVAAYVSMITVKALSEGFKGLTFIDLGCGDFRVGKQLLPLCSRYIGIDIVDPLVRHNQLNYGGEATEFRHLDAAEQELPPGDVCLIRQVLQHLSNQQIAEILERIKQYKWVFITEHYPTDNGDIVPNVDKVHGSDIRAYFNSGVYLDKPPFNVPADQLEEVLVVPGVGLSKEFDQGIIRTFLYKPTR